MASNIANVSGLIERNRSYEHIGVSLLQRKRSNQALEETLLQIFE